MSGTAPDIRGWEIVVSIIKRLAVAAVTCAAAAMVVVPVGAASGTDARSLSAYRAELVQAKGQCFERESQSANPVTVVVCIGQLAAPPTGAIEEINLFRLFDNCLYIAWQEHLDGLYG